MRQRQAVRQWKIKSIVSACCVCGDLRDDINGNGSWGHRDSYLRRYGLRHDDLAYSHTFCPACFMQYRALMGLDPNGVRLAAAKREWEKS